MRVENNGVRYFGFDELAESLNIKKSKKNNSDQLEQKQEKFLGVCNVCHTKMNYIKGTNIVACTNESCRGYKHTTKGKDGEDKVKYYPVFRVLNDSSASFAEFLFEEEA